MLNMLRLWLYGQNIDVEAEKISLKIKQTLSVLKQDRAKQIKIYDS